MMFTQVCLCVYVVSAGEGVRGNAAFFSISYRSGRPFSGSPNRKSFHRLAESSPEQASRKLGD